jgi:GT2 family glycosyltransferase
MYYDDVDLAWRARMLGERVRFVPAATVTHDYAFDRGAEKWFQLEHNRTWAVLSNYRTATLVALAPLLLAVEAAVAIRAHREGWGLQKRRAWAALARDRRALISWRRAVQAGRVVSDGAILARMTATMDTPLLDSALVRRANPWMERYRRALTGLSGV